MQKLRILFFYIVTLLKRKRKILAAVLVGALVLLSGIFYLVSRPDKQTISEGIVGTFTERDLPPVVTTLLSANLFRVDHTGSIVGDLVESYEVDTEGKVYTLKLREEKYWLDGTRIIASEIELPVADVETEIVDDRTIKLKLKEPFSPFLVLLDKPVFKKVNGGSEYRVSAIGTGPYKVREIKKDQIFVKKVILTSSDKNLPDLVIRFYPNEKIARSAIRLGEIQSLIGVNEYEELKQNQTLSVYSAANTKQLVTIFYNTKDAVLSDENFRLALSYASPEIEGEQIAKTSLPESSWAFNPEVKDYLNNPTQAKASFAKVQNGKDEPITLTATSSLEHVGQQVVDAWNKNGIKAVLRVESGIPQNFQALLITQNIPADPDQYSLWHSTQAQTNISKISSPRIDKDLEDGRKTSDKKLRTTRYQDFQKVLMDESPATFLYFPKKNVIYLKKIEGELQKVLNYQLLYI